MKPILAYLLFWKNQNFIYARQVNKQNSLTYTSAGKIVQQLKVLAVLAEDSGSRLSTYIVAQSPSIVPGPEYPNTLFWLLHACGAHKSRQIFIHKNQNKCLKTLKNKNTITSRTKFVHSGFWYPQTFFIKTLNMIICCIN